MSGLIRACLSTIRHWRFLMVDPIVVGMIDSGFRVEQSGKVLAARSFRLGDGEVDIGPAQSDRLGHGSCLLDVVAAHAPAVKFVIAQVFQDRMVTSAVLIAAGALVLGGCTGGAPGAEQSQAPQETSGPQQIRYMIGQPEDPADLELIKADIKKFESENDGISVKHGRRRARTEPRPGSPS